MKTKMYSFKKFLICEEKGPFSFGGKTPFLILVKIVWTKNICEYLLKIIDFIFITVLDLQNN